MWILIVILLSRESLYVSDLLNSPQLCKGLSNRLYFIIFRMLQCAWELFPSHQNERRSSTLPNRSNRKP